MAELLTAHAEPAALQSKQDRKRWCPVVKYPDGRLYSYVPQCMEHDRALKVAQDMATRANQRGAA